jgi:hypothetical protein
MDIIESRSVAPEKVATMTNCRLKATRERLLALTRMVEDEIDSRMGKGGGGLK